MHFPEHIAVSENRKTWHRLATCLDVAKIKISILMFDFKKNKVSFLNKLQWHEKYFLHIKLTLK